MMRYGREYRCARCGRDIKEKTQCLMVDAENWSNGWCVTLRSYCEEHAKPILDLLREHVPASLVAATELAYSLGERDRAAWRAAHGSNPEEHFDFDTMEAKGDLAVVVRAAIAHVHNECHAYRWTPSRKDAKEILHSYVQGLCPEPGSKILEEEEEAAR
jgi:hypothetical protein